MATNYMNLILPVVGPNGTMGPEWAQLINEAQLTIDSHDHSIGKGKAITPAGLNINQILSMNGNQISQILSLALNNLTSQPTANSLIYEFGGEMFFNDASGNQVQITSNGAINVASLGTITGDYSTSDADLTYSNAAKTFIFKQDATKTASVDHGPMKIYRNEVSSPYTMFQLNAAQSGNIPLTLLASLPASTLPIKVSATGVLESTQIIAADIASDAVTTAKILDANVTTAKIADLNVTTAKLADLNVTAGKLAADSVTTSKILDGSVTKVKLAALGQQVSASSGVYSLVGKPAGYNDVTNMAVTITTTGRPVYVAIQPDGGANSYIQITSAGLGNAIVGQLKLVRGATGIAANIAVSDTNGGAAGTIQIPAQMSQIDVVAAGTYTYKFQVAVPSSSNNVEVGNCVLVAYEL